MKFWSFCNVYLCIDKKKYFLDQTNTHKLVLKEKNIRRE